MSGSSRMAQDVTYSAYGATAVTPNDSTIIPVTRGLYIGGAGNVAVTMADGTTVTFNSAAAGQTLHLQVTKVMATGTTATNIVALY